MNINEKDIIILDDDHRYMIVKKIDFENRKYYYVSDIDNKETIKFLYEDGDELVEIEDEQLIENVIIKMFDTFDIDDFLRDLKTQLELKSNN